MICMPLSWKRPLRLDSRSTLMSPALPSAADAVIRTGFPNLCLRQIVALDARLPRTPDVGIAHNRCAFLARNVGRLPRQVGEVRKSRGDLISAPRLAHAIFHHG